MARTFRISTESPAMALAIAETINAEGHWATYLPGDKGPTVLAVCPMGARDAALRMFGLMPLAAR